jgi:methanogenic corrinoid protein MtbC1
MKLIGDEIMAIMEDLAKAIADLDEDGALKLVKDGLGEGVPALDLLRACQAGMAEVGKRFEREEYFVSDLMMSGEIFNSIAEFLAPALKAGGGASAGTVIMGTVKGDIHNIGKDIVVNMLKAANFDVIDLGVDVPPQVFVAKLKETGAKVLGMSGLLTLAFDSMKETIDCVKAAGLRDKVKIMVGGGPVDANVCRIVGADNWSTDAQKAVRMAQEWTA